MAKAKSKAIVSVADATGGLRQVHDRRFDQGEWPICFDVPKEEAETWFDYLRAECTKRGWTWSSIKQIESKENSGSTTVSAAGANAAQLAVVWDRKRGGPIKIRARSAGTPDFPLEQANDLFEKVNARSSAGAREEFFRGWHLFYNGLPWRGELWLEDNLRLGPPSMQDEQALSGPRIILVNASIKAIDHWHAGSAFEVMIRELAVFLTVVLGLNVRSSPNGGRGWTWTSNSAGQVECEIRNLGYWEKDFPNHMPARGEMRQVPLVKVQRPDFSLKGIDGTQNEIDVPEDIVNLWQAYKNLTPDRRMQFLQVANMWQLALSLDYSQHQTGRFAWMVVACEALKPREPEYRDHNIYHVIEALLGRQIAEVLKKDWFRPQDVRNAHLHSGEFRGSEFIAQAMMSSYEDPTFGEASREIFRITQAAIIEWLRRRGTFAMAPLKRRKTWKRWVREKALLLLPVLFGAGIVLGWFLCSFRHGQ